MKDLYEINQITRQNNDFKASITINPAHEIFAGHFPGQPVVPGVVLVEIAAAVLSQITGKVLVIREASVIKFLQVVDPRVNPVLWIDGSIVEESDTGCKANLRFYDGEIDFAKFKGIWFAFLASDD